VGRYRESNLTRNITFGILGLLGLIVASLYYQLYNLKSEFRAELAFAKGSGGTSDERLMSLQREVAQIQQNQSSAASTLARLEDRSSAVSQPTSPLNNVQITAVEGKLIREFLEKVHGLDPMVEAGYRVGDKIPNNRLLDFSILLTEKVPKLQNTKYTIDQKGSIIIVSEENRVVAILSTSR